MNHKHVWQSALDTARYLAKALGIPEDHPYDVKCPVCRVVLLHDSMVLKGMIPESLYGKEAL